MISANTWTYFAKLLAFATRGTPTYCVQVTMCRSFLRCIYYLYIYIFVANKSDKCAVYDMTRPYSHRNMALDAFLIGPLVQMNMSRELNGFWLIYAFILTLWRKAVELPQTVRTKSRRRHSNLCKHGKYFFRSGSMYFLDRRCVAHGLCAQKISKKGHGSKKESFIDCSSNSASLARHKNKEKNYHASMLPHMVSR